MIDFGSYPWIWAIIAMNTEKVHFDMADLLAKLALCPTPRGRLCCSPSTAWKRSRLHPSTTILIRPNLVMNRDPNRLVSEGAFLPDLLYRLKGISIVLPPLRVRFPPPS